MLKIGLTGGIGSGKSTVAQVFKSLGVQVYVADIEARRLMNKDRLLKEQLVEHLGKDIYGEDGLDRKRVAELIFSDPKLLQLVNNLVHPAVQRDFECWKEQYKDDAYLLEEAALLFESGAYKQMDYVLAVVANDDCRIRRVMERDKLKKADVLLRMKRQLSQEDFQKKADFTIINENDSMILPQIVALHNKFLKAD